jgi:hypothetical protein
MREGSKMAVDETKKALEASARSLASAIGSCRSALKERLDAYKELSRVVLSHPELSKAVNSVGMLEEALANLESIEQSAGFEMGLGNLRNAIAVVKRSKLQLDAIEPLSQALKALETIYGLLQ